MKKVAMVIGIVGVIAGVIGVTAVMQKAVQCYTTKVVGDASNAIEKLISWANSSKEIEE